MSPTPVITIFLSQGNESLTVCKVEHRELRGKQAEKQDIKNNDAKKNLPGLFISLLLILLIKRLTGFRCNFNHSYIFSSCQVLEIVVYRIYIRSI